MQQNRSKEEKIYTSYTKLQYLKDYWNVYQSCAQNMFQKQPFYHNI